MAATEVKASVAWIPPAFGRDPFRAVLDHKRGEAVAARERKVRDTLAPGIALAGPA